MVEIILIGIAICGVRLTVMGLEAVERREEEISRSFRNDERGCRF